VTPTFTALVNPMSGGDAAARLVPVARRLREAGATVTVEHTRSMEHGQQVAAEAAGRGEVVVAAGGDGMVGGVAGAVVAAGGTLGIVPAGRGNDFARQLGLPSEPDALAELLLRGAPRKVDVIDVAGQIVLGSVYAGVDSVANLHANRAKRLPASLVYVYGGARALLTWQPAAYHVNVDGTTYEARGYTIVVANSGYYGNGMHIAPDAEVDDGELDVVIIGAGPRWRFILGMRELGAGTHVNRPEVTVLRGRTVSITADRPVPAFGDGDPIGGLPLTARVAPKALNVLAPPAPA
jgi:diacylglycerol kinase (ATP)